MSLSVLEYEVVLDDLVADDYRRQLAPPPPPRPLLEYARSLKNATGEFKGQNYNPDLHMMQRVVIDEVQRSYDDPDNGYQDYALAADTQSGKSWVLQVILFYGLCELKLDVLMGLQDMRAAGDVWTKKLEPLLSGSGQGHYLPTSGSGSGGGSDIDTIHLNEAGSLLFFGAGGHRKAGGIDGRSIPWVYNDELDTLPRLVINKTDARADHFFRQGRRFKSSTVKGEPPSDKDSNILAAVAQGTCHRLRYKCPHCGDYTGLDLHQVRADFLTDLKSSTPSSAVASLRIHCTACGVGITDDERAGMLSSAKPVAPGQEIDRKGRVTGPVPDTKRFSLTCTCWDNPFKPFSKIATKWRAALVEAEAGRMQDLIDLYHDDFVMPSPREQGEESIDIGLLVSRSAAGTFTRGQVPAGADFLTAAIDQQKRMLIWQVMAHSLDGRHWIMAWGYQTVCQERTEPTEEQRLEAYAQIELIMAAGFTRQDSNEVLRPVIIGMDTADWPDIAAKWIPKHRGWIAVHGAGADMVKKLKRASGNKVAELAGWFDVIEYAKPRAWKMIWPHSDSVKHQVSSALRREADLPESMMLPRGLGAGDDLIMHLQAERFEYSKDLKRKAWLKTGYRFNDLWDDAYYNLVLFIYWITEHPGWQPSKSTSTPESDAREDDDAKELGWTPELGWQ